MTKDCPHPRMAHHQAKALSRRRWMLRPWRVYVETWCTQHMAWHSVHQKR